jgi:hypothetical protein
MKHIKTYENVSTSPKVGDYVLGKFEWKDNIWSDYIYNNIGIIDHISSSISTISGDDIKYYTKYTINDYIYKEFFLKRNQTYNVVDENGDKYIIMSFTRKNIIEFASTKEELEIIIRSTKYNL